MIKFSESLKYLELFLYGWSAADQLTDINEKPPVKGVIHSITNKTKRRLRRTKL